MQSPGTSATLPPPLQTARFQEKREALLDAAARHFNAQGVKGATLGEIAAQVGLVTLIGLAAKNGILIVEVAEQHVEEGMGIAEAAMAAAESRMRPILMTAIASLAGFLPLVVATTAGANSQQSLGTVIFGGLLVATVLSLGVVPPFYVLIKQLEERWFAKPELNADTDLA
jgi:multidrug efflux pump subunit AcrB